MQAGYFVDDFQPWAAAEGRDGNYYTSLLEGGFPGGSMCQFTPKGTVRRFGPFPRIRVSPQAAPFGTHPEGRVSVGQDGAIYGSTREGGVFGGGLVFRIDPRGTYTTIHHIRIFGYGYKGPTFVASNGDVYATIGYDPNWMLHLHRDGRDVASVVPGSLLVFAENASHEVIAGTYKVVQKPGFPTTYAGQLWRVTAEGQFVPLADLGGGTPRQLTLLPDGTFLCLAGDEILKVSMSGEVTTVHQFASPFHGLNPDFLVVGKDGNYYGSTSAGGLERSGTVYRITADTHEFTVLRHLHLDHRFGHGVVWLKSVLPLWTAARAGNILPRAYDDFVEAASLKPSPAGALPARVVAVLKNDSDANRDPLTIVSVSTPSRGVAAFDYVAQKITYTPNTTNTENDAFSYTIVDGSGGSATGQVIIRARAGGSYQGTVSSPANPNTGDPGTSVGTLAVRLNDARTYTARLDLLGRVYRFTRRFNDRNTSGVVLESNPRLGTSLGLELWLRPNGAGWTVEATIRKNSLPYSASCVPTAAN